MTLPAGTRYKLYQPVVLTDVYLVTFPIFANADLLVFVDGAENADYTVSATYVDGQSNDAAITLTASVTGVDVEIYGDRDPRRENSYLPGSPDLSVNTQRDMGSLTAVQQEQKRNYGSTLRVSSQSPITSAIKGSAADRANSVPIFSADGTGLENGPTADEISGAQGYAETSQAIAAQFGDVDGAIGAAETARDKSQEWADEVEDTEVETGKYSGRHHSAKASADRVLGEAARTGSVAAKVGSENARDLAETYAGVDHRAATWTALSAISGLTGEVGYVGPEDTGTHTDPIAAGTVDNEGVYEWAADGLGSAQAERTASTGLAGFQTQVDTLETDALDLTSSLQDVIQTIGIVGDLPVAGNASFGTYTLVKSIENSGTGVRYHYKSNGAGTIHVQIAEVTGSTKAIISERLITVSGAGDGVAEFLDLEYVAGQHLSVRASPSGVLTAESGTDEDGGWWYTTAAVPAGSDYIDANPTASARVLHRFELLEQVVTGPRFAAIEKSLTELAGDDDAATFHLHLVIGESHAAGVPTTLSPVSIPIGNGYCYRRATTGLGHLQDPTGNSATAIAGTGRGSPFVALGAQFLQQSGNMQGAIVVNSAAGGTTAYNHWASGGGSWLQAVDDWTNALIAVESDELIIAGKSISIILGSNDAATGTSKVDFKAAMLDIIARARTLVDGGTDVPVVMVQTGPYADGSYATEVAYIQAAQEEIAREESNVYMGYSARFNVSRGQMIDNVHMTQVFNDLCGVSVAIPAAIHGAGL